MSQRPIIEDWTPKALFIRPEVRYYLRASGSCLGTPYWEVLIGLSSWYAKPLGTNQAQ